MAQPLRVLIVEDNPHDAELVMRGLRRAGYDPDWRRVETEAAYLAALDARLDLVVSDYAMPEFNGLRALALLQQRALDVPFILVSATIGEETAVTAIKQGAADYLLKDRMTRLGPAVEHALAEARLRRERRAAELAQARAEAKYRGIFEHSVEGLYQTAASGRLLIANPALARMAGYASPAEMIAQVTHVGQFYVDARDRARFEAQMRTDGSVNGFETRMRRRDGAIFWVAIDARTMRNEQGEFCYEGALRDISERKRAEEELRASEERFRQVVENIREVFWMVDAEQNRVLYVSPGYEAIWGRSCESLYGSARTWLEAVHPDDRKRMFDAAASKQSQGTYNETYRILRPDGTVRWIHDRAYPIADAAGVVRRVVGVAEDVTSEREMETKFLRTQRLEAIGTLSSGIAHDLNNILAPMLMASGLLRTELKDTRNRELIAMIELGAQRGANIIRQLLTFSRGIEGERVSVQVRHLVREMAAMARETFPRNITVVEEGARDLRTVAADATQLHQVLMNLCVNARDAMPEGGTLVLRVENATLTPATLPPHHEAKPGTFVRLTIADTGHGIPPEIIERIFDPFFTTKGIGKGTGLGLSTVLGIVKSHGGFVTVNSTPGQGTEFNVYLPAEGAATVPTATVPPAPPPRGSGELILVVDDEPAVREATSSALQNWNYRVMAAADGEAGLATFRRHAPEVSAAIVDLMMPVMDGAKLVAALRALAPELKIVAVTGLEPGEQRASLEMLGVEEVLMKPFTPQRLLETLAAALRPHSRHAG